MTNYVNQNLSGKVVLDDNSFTECTFDNVELVYSGGEPPRLSSNTFKNFKFSFEGAAANTAAFLRAMAAPGSGLQHVVRNTFPTLTAN